MSKQPRSIDHPYNLSRHVIPWMQDCPFYAEISRHIAKRATTDIATAAISFDERADELMMWYNPYFFGGGEYAAPDGTLVNEEGLRPWETRGVMTHEFDHVVYGHLGARRRTPSDIDNIAKDLAINSLILARQGQPKNIPPGTKERILPRIGLVPGQRPWVDPDKHTQMSTERKKALERFSDLIEKMEPMKASEHYFAVLMADKVKNPEAYEALGLGQEKGSMIVGFDDHDMWGDVSDEVREIIEGKVKALIEKAVRHADNHPNGWGNIPAELREEIRRSISTVVNWKVVLRQFMGTLVRGERSTSIKRINRRYPYVHPGTKRGYVAKLLIAVDQSGSVGDEMLQMFFAEMERLTQKVDITLLPFDCSCSQSDLYEWRKGTRPVLNRVKMGGTNFDAPTNLANDPKNRGRWDGLLIMTDGCASAPVNSRIKRGWVLGQGCKLAFDSQETQIFLSNEQRSVGAWK